MDLPEKRTLLCGHGRGHDDPAEVIPPHDGNGIFAAEESSRDIGVLHALPVLQRHVINGVIAVHSGIIAKDIETPEVFVYSLKHSLYLSFGADIGTDHNCLAAHCANGFGHLVRLFL